MLRLKVRIVSGHLENRTVRPGGADELQIMKIKDPAVAGVPDAVPADRDVPHRHPDACPVTEVKAEALHGLLGMVEPDGEVRELILLQVQIALHRVLLTVLSVEAPHDVEDLRVHHAAVVRPDVCAYLIRGLQREEAERPREEEYR